VNKPHQSQTDFFPVAMNNGESAAAATGTKGFRKNFKTFKKLLGISRGSSHLPYEADKTLSSLADKAKDVEVSSDSLSSRPDDFAHPVESMKLQSEESYRKSLDNHSGYSTTAKSKANEPQAAVYVLKNDHSSDNDAVETENHEPLHPDKQSTPTIPGYPLNEYMQTPTKFLSRLVPIADQSTIWENYFHYSTQDFSRSSTTSRKTRSSTTKMNESSMKRVSKTEKLLAGLTRVRSETDIMYATKDKGFISLARKLKVKAHPSLNDTASLDTPPTIHRSRSVETLQRHRVKETTLVFSSTPGPQRITYKSGLTEFTRGKVNEFLMIREIGSGASGKVILAQHEESGCYYACKIVDKHRTRRTHRTFALGPHASVSTNGTATHPNIVREIALLKRVVSHPHVNSLVEFIDDAAERNIYMGI
jgi:hypothetical protein